MFSVERGVPVEGQIVIGTPGTVLDWCTKLRVMDLKKINVFVLDEADVMIDTQGHQDQSIRIQRYNKFNDCLSSDRFKEVMYVNNTGNLDFCDM